jgi:hypothetical protein
MLSTRFLDGRICLSNNAASRAAETRDMLPQHTAVLSGCLLHCLRENRRFRTMNPELQIVTAAKPAHIAGFPRVSRYWGLLLPEIGN